MKVWRVAVCVATPLIGVAAVVACSLEQAGLQPSGADAAPDVTVDVISTDTGTGDAPLPPPDGPTIDAGPDVVDASPLSPGDIPGLRFWVRSDLGVEVADGGDAATVTAWRDLVDASPHDLVPSPVAPQLIPAAGNYNGKPGVSFGTVDARLFNTTLSIAQPLTVLVVGHATTDVSYFLDSTTATRISLITTTGRKIVLYAGGGYAPPLGTGKVDVPTVIVAVFDGNKSSLYLSSNTPLSNLNPGASGLIGISLGNYQTNTYGLFGILTEAAIWQGVLDNLTVRRLNAYAGPRYGITIAP